MSGVLILSLISFFNDNWNLMVLNQCYFLTLVSFIKSNQFIFHLIINGLDLPPHYNGYYKTFITSFKADKWTLIVIEVGSLCWASTSQCSSLLFPGLRKPNKNLGDIIVKQHIFQLRFNFLSDIIVNDNWTLMKTMFGSIYGALIPSCSLLLPKV